MTGLVTAGLSAPVEVGTVVTGAVPSAPAGAGVLIRLLMREV